MLGRGVVIFGLSLLVAPQIEAQEPNRRYGLPGAIIRGTGNCPMTVYLDGTRIIGKLNPRGEDPVNLMVKPGAIAGAEIYPRGVGAPPQYQELNGSCGIVLIWTR